MLVHPRLRCPHGPVCFLPTKSTADGDHRGDNGGGDDERTDSWQWACSFARDGDCSFQPQPATPAEVTSYRARTATDPLREATPEAQAGPTPAPSSATGPATPADVTDVKPPIRKVWRKKRALAEMMADGDYCVSCGTLCECPVAAAGDDDDPKRGDAAEVGSGTDGTVAHEGHAGHQIIPAPDWTLPTELLSARSERKSFAQFFFSPRSVTNIGRWVMGGLGAKRIVCVGCPRMHEHFLAQDGTKVKF